MRLICPNCGAQYEVADDVIPADGRDVQCSNCGHTWFEGRGASQAAESEAEAQVATQADDHSATQEPLPESETEPGPEVDIETDAEPEPEPDAVAVSRPDAKENFAETAEAEPESVPDAPKGKPIVPKRPYVGSIKEAFEDVDQPESDDISASVTADFDDDEPPLVTTPPRRAVDASVAGILREEAEREAAARRRDSDGGLETQGDLGLTDAPKKQNDLASKYSDVSDSSSKQSVTAAAVAATVAAASRKELLPDIEEINSSLRSNAERGETTIPDPEELIEAERRGFHFGFFSVLILIIALTLIYVFAPQIAEKAPALSGVLQGYVDLVDSGRLWLDLKMQELLEKMRPV